jgi:hypothetical protein
MNAKAIHGKSYSAMVMAVRTLLHPDEYHAH